MMPLGVSLTCAAPVLALAAHYPLGPTWAAPVASPPQHLLTSGRRRLAWLAALLPLAGRRGRAGSASTNSICSRSPSQRAAMRARMALHADSPLRVDRGMSRLAWLVAALFALSLASAAARGIEDAGGWRFGWYQGYQEPLNSLRLAKGFVLACLLLPLWNAAARETTPERVARDLSLGVVAGLGAAALGAVWERVAFPGLLDFSSDYRTMALFWEMHVGSAAFDGFLALTMPFAVRELAAVRTAQRWLAAALVTLLRATPASPRSRAACM